jgi:hypothetical protein
MSDAQLASAVSTSAAEEAERRLWVRYTSVLEASCSRAGIPNDLHWPGRVVNLSVSGIGLLVRRRFLGGTLLEVELKTRSAQVLQVEVIHATAIKDEDGSFWLLGCAFARELTDAEWGSLLRVGNESQQ